MKKIITATGLLLLAFSAGAQVPSNLDLYGTYPYLKLNNTSGTGSNINVFFTQDNDDHFALGKRANGSFYITRNKPGYGWVNNSFVIHRESGNIGIGSENPQQKLQIGFSGENGPYNYNKLSIPGQYNFENVYLGQFGNGSAGLEFINHVGLYASYGIRMKANVDEVAGLQFQYAGATTAESGLVYTTGMFMGLDGSVGVGTVTPGAYKLAVNGTIGTKKVVVTQTGWADYVFDSSYRLMSLPEVAAFIKTNKHLPEIPAAAKVAADGLDVGDTQRLLLQKIEELTLYLIEQHKKNEALARQLAEQQKRLAALEAAVQAK
jgi:hypothetical protein